MRIWAAILLACSACGGIPEGRFACTTAGDCPSGWSCRADGRCHSTPGDLEDGGIEDGGPLGPVLYVSPTGNDRSDGLSTSSPKQTIVGALEAARADRSIAEIHVCEGEYRQSGLVLDIPVTLRGGYDCATFGERSASYGYPMFDAMHRTLIAPMAPAGAEELTCALRISGAGVTSIVDGFEIAGPSSNLNATCGVEVRDGAAPILEDNRINAAVGVDTALLGWGSAGVVVRGGAAPEIVHDDIVGGSGTSATSWGSVGVVTMPDASPATAIHDASIDGGSGSTASLIHAGSVGILLEREASIDANGIRGGSGSNMAASGLGSIGVRIAGSVIVAQRTANPVRDNSIYGGLGRCQSGPCSAGVLTDAPEVDLVANTIDAGNGLGPSEQAFRGVSVSGGLVSLFGNRISAVATSAFSSSVAGVVVENAGAIRLFNNMIFAGAAYEPRPEPVVALAVLLAGSSAGNIVQHNTIVLGRVGPSGIGVAIDLRSGTGAIVEDNILLYGNADAGSYQGVALAQCADTGIVHRVNYNLFFGSENRALVYYTVPPVSAPCTPGTGFDPAELANELIGRCTSATPGACNGFGGSVATGNRYLFATCTAAIGNCLAVPGCASETDPNGCASTLFEGWTNVDLGLGALVTTGWRLSANLPCALSSGGLFVGVGDDFFEAPRTAPPSPGAHEQDLCL